MNLGENIFNAFDVVYQTYESIAKLMDYCRAMASEKGEYVLSAPKFLRYKSDNDIYGWSMSGFIMLFQNAEDDELENGWRDGSVYVLEINLYEPECYNVPMINVAKYEYDDIASWSEGCSPTNYKIFYNPLYCGYVDFEQSGNFYTGYIKDTEYADNRLWGLRQISGCEIPLTEITHENAYDKIFGGFNSLNELYPTERTAVPSITVKKPKVINRTVKKPTPIIK